MSFLSNLFKKLKKQPASPLQNTLPAKAAAPAAKAEPTRSAADPLAELRYQARTGDPSVPVRHRSGSFGEKE